MDVADTVEVLGVVAGARERGIIAPALGNGEGVFLPTRRRRWRWYTGLFLVFDGGSLPAGFDEAGRRPTLDVPHAGSGDFLRGGRALQDVHEFGRGQGLQVAVEDWGEWCGGGRGEVEG